MSRRSRFGIVAAFIFAVGMLSPLGRATIISDNMSNAGAGFFGVGAGQWEAQRFNSDATNLVLTSATLSLTQSTAGQYRLSLYSDAANSPGVVVGTLFNGTTTTKPASGSVTFSGLSQPMLPNTNYWIVLSVDAAQPTSIGWEATSTLTGSGTGFQLASKFTTNSGSSWTDRSAPHKMQVVASTPEPGSTGLVVLGVMGLLAKRRVHKRL